MTYSRSEILAELKRRGIDNPEEQMEMQPTSQLSREDILNELRRRNVPVEQYTAQTPQQQHPLLYKIAEALQGTPGLEAASNAAGKFNRFVEGSGLPSAAKGAFGTAIDMGRGIANLIPGVNIPEAQYPELNVNPHWGKAAETAGSFVGSIPAYKGYQALKGGLNAARIPSAISSILAGGATGSAITPEHRLGGAALGAGTAAIPELAKIPGAFKKTDPFKVIQEGYDTQENALARSFEKTGREIEKQGINKIPVRKDLLDEVKELGPHTKKFSSFVDKAKEGDFRALRRLQSELWQQSKRYSSSPLGSEKDVGEAISEVRDEINQSIANHLTESGHPDLAEAIRKATAGWRGLQETYHSNPTISKLVGANRKVPSTNKILHEQSVQMDRLRGLHPEIAKALKREKNMGRLSTTGKAVLGGTGIGGAAALISKLLA